MNGLGRFFRGFGYAARGIHTAVRQERNLRIHLCTACYVIAFERLFYTLSLSQRAVLYLTIAAVVALELVNSAIERAVDHACGERDKLARDAKDMAAGAVLVGATGAVAVGAVLLWNRDAFARIQSAFQNPLALAALALSVILSICFIVLYKEK